MSDEQIRRDAIDDACEKWFSKVEVSEYTGVEVKHVYMAYQAAHQSRQAEIDRLTAELAECKKNAERYRWLCASDWYIGPEPQGDTNVVSLYNENTDNEGLNLSKEIDAAMESKNDNT